MPMGRPAASTSRASRVLAYLRTRPNERVATREIADALGLTIENVTGAIATKLNRGPQPRTDDWRNVVHAMHGAWTYQTDVAPAPTHTGEWASLGEQDDCVVLRGPDGKLWVARPL